MAPLKAGPSGSLLTGEAVDQRLSTRDWGPSLDMGGRALRRHLGKEEEDGTERGGGGKRRVDVDPPFKDLQGLELRVQGGEAESCDRDLDFLPVPDDGDQRVHFPFV